ncbi:uncharacterized protein N7529_004084 [Penicillium soppii]|uniref:uncharacterized protein n=1 Tax=Penicillium soppii TaxID=69789 RepID=UPI002548530A|nr:uncharacterized protein N7529_004084 [Penicillium soppii]KAJ5871731.1 hypothetical protein N7529_004084 [Penicillium soppii]
MLLSPALPGINVAPDALEAPKNNKYPKRGLQAWSVVLGAWCVMVPSMGLLNSLGILQVQEDVCKDCLAGIICYAVFLSFWSGPAFSLTPVFISQMCATEDCGKRNGTTFIIVSFGTLVGIPIVGAIQGRGGGEYGGLTAFGEGL